MLRFVVAAALACTVVPSAVRAQSEEDVAETIAKFKEVLEEELNGGFEATQKKGFHRSSMSGVPSKASATASSITRFRRRPRSKDITGTQFTSPVGLRRKASPDKARTRDAGSPVAA